MWYESVYSPTAISLKWFKVKLIILIIYQNLIDDIKDLQNHIYVRDLKNIWDIQVSQKIIFVARTVYMLSAEVKLESYIFVTSYMKSLRTYKNKFAISMSVYTNILPLDIYFVYLNKTACILILNNKMQLCVS